MPIVHHYDNLPQHYALLPCEDDDGDDDHHHHDGSILTFDDVIKEKERS